MKYVIVVPAFNSSKYIEDCLKSVQKCQSLILVKKVILVDDGSTDNTVDLAKNCWERRDIPLEIVLNGKNLGQWPSKNKIISSLINQYDWMFLLHSDDMVREDWIESIIEKIEIDNEFDLIFSEISTIKRNERQNEKSKDWESNIINVHKGSIHEIKMALVRGCYWRISGSAFKLKVFEEIGLFSNKFPYAGDYYWFLNFLREGKTISYLPKSLLYNRKRSDSVAGKAHMNDRDIKEFIEIYSDYSDYFNYDMLSKTFGVRLYWTIKRIMKRTIRLQFLRVIAGINTFIFVYKRCQIMKKTLKKK